jgi:hypothetical protein
MRPLSNAARRQTRHALAALVLALAAALVLLNVGKASAARGSAGDQALALQWFDTTNATVAAAGFPQPVTQTRTWAVSWLAAARAVQDGGSPSFQRAAFATALHDTLVSQVPTRQAELDDALATTLDAIPDGKQKSRGIAAGESEASAVLAE